MNDFFPETDLTDAQRDELATHGAITLGGEAYRYFKTTRDGVAWLRSERRGKLPATDVRHLNTSP